MTHQTPLPGSPAPALTFDILDGDTFSLDGNRPESFSLVFFYRGAHCPICKTQLEELNGKLDGFSDLGIDVHVVSMDNEERARRQRRDWQIDNLRIGYNLSEETARNWGLFVSPGAKEAEPERFSEPGVAVIQPDGTIYALYLQSVPFARPTADDLRKGLSFILENDYPVRGDLAA